MKQRTILNQDHLRKACEDLAKLGGNLPIVITLTEGTKTRSHGQNARYWCEIEHFMEQVNEAIEIAATESGHSEFEIKKILANQLPIEQSIILFARKKEVTHDILKGICNIPSSTKLGTKDFMKFEDRLSQTMMEIIGNIRGFLNT